MASESMCGAARMTNLPVGFSKPSLFMRIWPWRRISTGHSRPGTPPSEGGNSAMNSLSLAGSDEMKSMSIPRLLSARWQVPQVRPLPAKVSRKKRSAPSPTAWLTSPRATRI